MRPVAVVGLFLCYVFAGGAVLAPWLYRGVASLATSVPALLPLTEQPFHRYVSRSFLILGVVGLWPLIRGLHARQIPVRHWFRGSDAGRDLTQGFVVGWLCLLVVVLAAVLGGARSLAIEGHSSGAWVRHLLNATGAAVVVALIEEVFFRGVVLGGLRPALGVRGAIFVSAGLYALLHFMARPASPEVVGAGSGFVALAGMFRGFTEWQGWFPAWINLFVAGCILGVATVRRESLAWAIGLHAGWIFWLKTYGFVTRELEGASGWIWGSRKLIDGWSALVPLLIVWAWVRMLPGPTQGVSEKEVGR